MSGEEPVSSCCRTGGCPGCPSTVAREVAKSPDSAREARVLVLKYILEGLQIQREAFDEEIKVAEQELFILTGGTL